MERQIRLFVSSTFVDMHEERDLLARGCFPRARRRFAQAGIVFAEIDLRWGLPVSESEASIVNLCIAEVERCRGYFICILGSRYGHVPASDPEQRSVTEIEICTGAFADPPPAFVRFYFKRGAVDDCPALTALKTRIRARFAVIEYGSPHHLAELVLADLDTLAASQAAANHHGLPAAGTYAWHRQEAHSGPPSAGLAQLDAFLRSKQAQLCVHGPSGSGKSILLASWFSQRAGSRVYPAPGAWKQLWRFLKHRGALPLLAPPLWLIHCAGDLTDAGGLSPLLDAFLARLRTALDEPAAAVAGPLKDRLLAFHRLLGRAAATHEAVMVVIDDADALLLDPALPFHWLPPSISNVKLILSGRAHGVVAQLDPGWPRLLVSGLEKDELVRALESYLLRYGKSLAPEALAALAQVGHLRRPLGMRIAADELRLARSPAQVAEMVDLISATATAAQLFERVLDRLEREHGAVLVATICGLIACSRGGLWEAELNAIAGRSVSLTPIQWSSVVQAFGRSAIDHDGLYALHFQEMREAVAARYLPDAQAHAAYRSQLIAWMENERQQAALSRERLVHELPWQLCQAGDWDGLLTLLVDPDFFMQSWQDDPSQLIGWWRMVQTAGAGAGDAPSAWSRSAARTSIAPLQEATLALLFAELGHAEAAAQCIRNLLDAAPGPHDEPRMFTYLVNLAGFLLESQQDGAAADSLGLAAAMLPAIASQALRANYLNAAGNLALKTDQVGKAIDHYLEAERLHRDTGNQQAAAECRHNRALAMLRAGQGNAARRLLKECATVFRAVHDIELLCKTSIQLACAHEMSGQLGRARRSIVQAEYLARARHDWQLLGHALQVHARIQELNGDRDGAEERYLECGRLYRRFGSRTNEVDILLARATVRLNLGQRGHRSASGLLAEAQALAPGTATPAQHARIAILQERIGIGPSSGATPHPGKPARPEQEL